MAETHVVMLVTQRQPDAACDTHNRHQQGWITWPAIRRARAISPGGRLHRTTVRHLL